MKKIIIISLIVLVVLFTLAIVYLNNVYLPKTIHSLIIKGIEENTGSRATLGAIKVNIFKGLVLTDLNIYQEENPLIEVKEASCIVLPFAFLRKQIIIPNISIKSARVFLERRKDNTFNLASLFSPQTPPATSSVSTASPKAPAHPSKGFSFYVYRVNLSNSEIIFRDSTLDKPFIKNVKNLNLTAYLSLPAAVKFNLSAIVPAVQPIKIRASGEFKIPQRELSAKLNILNFSPDELSVYYQGSGLKIPTGLINALVDLRVKENLLSADLQAQGNDLNIRLNNIGIKTSPELRAVLEYDLGAKTLKYSGSCQIKGTEISGVEFIDKISAVNATVTFNNSGLKTQDLSAVVLGLPFKGQATLDNFSDPYVDVNVVSGLNLASLQGLLKDKFKFDFPGTIDGKGNLYFAAKGRLSAAGDLETSGYIEFIDAGLNLKNINYPIQGINGKVSFSKDKLSPALLLGVDLKSSEISLASDLNFNNKLLKVLQCSGSYLNSEFQVSGNIDSADDSGPQVDLAGELLIDLKDLKVPLRKFREQLDKANPEGKLNAKFNLTGQANDLAGCAINVEVAADAVSLYGLKGQNLFINYIQEAGIASISSLRLSLYSGSLNAFFRTNLKSGNYPYLLNANIQDVRIEELKLDTPAKAKDISGIIQGEVKASGLLGDLAGSQGSGTIAITKGKLWELDLFKGMGKLLFSQDLANVTFNEGSCAFNIQDKSIFSDKLELKSNMVNLSGPVKIGFDGSILAKLNVNILDEFVPLTGTFKDVATAIIGQSGKFAEIKISGTLKEPKYRFQAAVTDIIKSLADTFLKRI
ncbi:MAG: AsmA family protein [Candidatus Omnitrophica bacterium]|nr:AsmA family protein [Candidatus Omnitrophota bacterium]